MTPAIIRLGTRGSLASPVVSDYHPILTFARPARLEAATARQQQQQRNPYHDWKTLTPNNNDSRWRCAWRRRQLLKLRNDGWGDLCFRRSSSIMLMFVRQGATAPRSGAASRAGLVSDVQSTRVAGTNGRRTRGPRTSGGAVVRGRMWNMELWA